MVYVVLPAAELTSAKVGQSVISLLAITVLVIARPLDRLFAAYSPSDAAP